MSKTTHHMTVWTAVAALCLLGHACDEKNSDVRDIADALSEDFTVGLDFDDPSTNEDGQPPEAHVDDPDFPKITSLNYSPTLDVTATDSMFTIALNGQWDNQPANLQIVGAAVYVAQANKDDYAQSYIRVLPAAPTQDGNMVLSGNLRYNPALAGNSFMVLFSLLVVDINDRTTYLASNYVMWHLTLPAFGMGTVPECGSETGITYPPSPNHESGTGEISDQQWHLYPANVGIVGICPERELAELWKAAISGYLEWDPGMNEDLYPISFGQFPSGTRFQPILRPEMKPAGEHCWIQIDCAEEQSFDAPPIPGSP
jgi:hypothetical protein